VTLPADYCGNTAVARRGTAFTSSRVGIRLRFDQDGGEQQNRGLAEAITTDRECYHAIMIRTQIQLTAEQAARLRDLAAAEGRSMADVIRESVDAYLAEAPLRRTADSLRADAIALAGRYDSRLGDLAEGHDRYLAEDLAR
jgi:hypothetical protein